MAWDAQSTQNIKFALSMQYLKKEGRDEVDFLHADKHQTFRKLMPSLLVGMVIYAQKIQNNKFAKSLKYLDKELWNEVDIFCR